MDTTTESQATTSNAPIAPTNPDAVAKSVTIGKTAIAGGKTKKDAVKLMFPLLIDEPREVIWQAFVAGAGLTEKGAVTYHYNLKRAYKKGKLKAYFEDQP